LQPAVGWREQVDDVARAVAWVHREIGGYGGDPQAIFLAGHSAGGQLVARIGLDRTPLDRLGVDPGAIRGLIPVSGAAFDIADDATYALGADPAYYARRFQEGDPGLGWRTAGSVVPHARADAPPSLIVYAEGDSAPLRRQSQRLDEALRAAGAQSRVVVVPGESHTRMVLVLSHPGKVAAAAILEFVSDRSGRRDRKGLCGAVDTAG
jgi:arylformamidase